MLPGWSFRVLFSAIGTKGSLLGCRETVVVAHDTRVCHFSLMKYSSSPNRARYVGPLRALLGEADLRSMALHFAVGYDAELS